MMFLQGKYDDDVLETSGINNLLRVQLPTGASTTRAGSHAHNVDAADPKISPLQNKNSYNADSTISSLQTQQLLHCRLHNFSTADPKTSRSCAPQVHNHLKVAMADETHTPPLLVL